MRYEYYIFILMALIIMRSNTFFDFDLSINYI
nr:MAG TPA: hypothetical protein [Caudoviricetes sp.]